MRFAALFFLSTLCAFAHANPHKIIFRNIQTGEFRILENGVLSEPAKGMANGVNAAGEGPLGVVYHDNAKWRDITTTHGTDDPKHGEEVTALCAVIGEYNAPRLPLSESIVPKGAPKSRFIGSYFDPRTGLALTAAESKQVGGFSGFVFEYREGKWIGHTGKEPPNFFVTKVAEATRQAAYKLPRCRLPFLNL